MSFLSIRSTFYWPRDYWRETNLSDRNFVMAAHNIDNTYIHFEFQLIFSRSLLNVFTQSIDWRKPLVWCIDCSWHSKSWEECVKQPIQIHFRPILCYNLIEDSLWYSKSNSFDKILTKFWMFLVIRTKLIWITNYNKFSL